MIFAPKQPRARRRPPPVGGPWAGIACLLVTLACAPGGPAPVEVDLGRTSPEAAELIRALRDAAATDPGDAAKRGTFGLALEANGMPRAAVRTYLQAEGLDGNDPRWSYLAAVTSAQLGEFDTALAAIDRSLALDARYVPAHLYRGSWSLDLGRVDEAQAAFDHARRLDPDNRFEIYGRARVHLRRDEATRAVELLESRLTGGERDPYLQQLLGLAYRQVGDPDRAAESLAIGRGERPPMWPDRRRQRLADYARGYAAEKQRADAFIQAGRWQEAVETLEPLREHHSQDPDMLTNLALAYRNVGRADDSIRVLLSGLRHHPEHVHLHINLGVAYEQQGRYGEALEKLDRAIALNPNLAFVHERKGGILLLRLHRLEDAVAAFERARTLDPHNGDVLGALAIAHLDLGEFDRAEARLVDLERRFPGSPRVARLRAELERRRAEAS